MQTIRIYDKKTGSLVHSVTGIAYKVETDQLRQQFPESHYNWLRWFQVLQGCNSPVMRVILHGNNVG